METPSVTEALANISQYLWTYKIARDNSFFNGNNNLNDGRDVVLLVQNAALSWGVENSLDGLQGVANNVYVLCGATLQESKEVLSSGSGGIVVPPSIGGGGLTPFPINVTISSGQSGVSTLQDSDWIGLEDIVQITINQSVYQLGTGFTFNSVSGTFDLSLSGYILQEGDKFTSLGFMPTS